MASTVETIQKILQETIAPGISRLEIELAGVKADIREIRVEIKRLDDRIENLDGKMTARMDHLKEEMASGFGRQSERMDHLEDKIHTALEIRERLAALEARIGH